MPFLPTPILRIEPVPAVQLHQYWPLIERGLHDICRKIHPDWLPPDVYSALRAEAATVCMVSRVTRTLGFFIYHRQERPWSHILDVFVWAVWAIPPRERIPTDNIPEAIWRGREYLYKVKCDIGANRVLAIGRKGWARAYGLKVLFTTFEV